MAALLLASMSLTMAPAVIPAVTETVSAASAESGSLGDGFKWKWEADSGTLTITGRGEIPENLSRLPEIPEGGVKTLVIGKNVTDASVLTSVFQEIKPSESFIVEEGNRYLSASGGGLYSSDGKTLISYATGVADIVIPDGVEAVGPYAFLDCLPDSIILPESVTTLDSHTFSGMKDEGQVVAVVLPKRDRPVDYQTPNNCYYEVMFFYTMEDGSPACQFSGSPKDATDGGVLMEEWAKFGFRTPAEIYAGETGTKYGVRPLKMVYVVRDEVYISNYALFSTAEGPYWDGFVYDSGKVYYISSVLCDVTGLWTYDAADGTEKRTFLTDNADCSLRNPPLDLMVVTIDSLTPVSLSAATDGKGVYTSPDTGFRGLVYRDGKAYIYDDNGQMQKSGWYEADGNWYYLNDYGAGAVSCWREGTDGSPRYLKADGKMARNEWIEDYHKWYYLGLDGVPVTGARTLDGTEYRFDENGVLLSGEPG